VSELTPAPNGYPIKLVYDGTASIINSTGEPGALFYGSIPAGERPVWLRRKLIEETAEYVESRGVAELGDVLAVVEGLAATHGLTLEELTAKRREDPRAGLLAGQMMYGYHEEFDGR
jgi:predicted house-cleaning noncanonical NTP pyrophosphatase (MazG superfamily)